MKPKRLIKARGHATAAVCLLAAGLALPASATVWYVDAANGDDAYVGDSWDYPFATVQRALSVAYPVDVIWVADGTYKPTEGLTPPEPLPDEWERQQSFVLRYNNDLYGGFLGVSPAFPNGEPELPDRDVHGNPAATLDGDLADNDIPANFYYLLGNRSDNSFHVVRTTSDSTEMRLDGFTVKSGYAAGRESSEPIGGGVYVHNSEVAIINCTLRQNSAGYGETQDPECEFWSCVNGRGGALFVATNTEDEFSIESDVSIYDCRFTDNHVRGHHTLGVDGDSGGAGIYCSATQCTTTLEIVNSLFDNNEAYYKSVECDDEWYLDGTNGGAIFNQNADVTMISCTVADNTADVSEGYDPPPSPGNQVFGYGGGIYNAAGTVTIHDGIFWRNTDVDVDQLANTSQIYMTGGTITINYSDVQGGCNTALWTCTAVMNQAPDFVAGDPYNYQLKWNSPCLNAGDNTPVPDDAFDVDDDEITTGEKTPDLRLAERVSQTTVDMGAYEHCLGDADDDGIVNVMDLLAVLGDWGCGVRFPTDAPQDVQDCIDKYGDDIEQMLGCIEAILKTEE